MVGLGRWRSHVLWPNLMKSWATASPVEEPWTMARKRSGSKFQHALFTHGRGPRSFKGPAIPVPRHSVFATSCSISVSVSVL